MENVFKPVQRIDIKFLVQAMISFVIEKILYVNNIIHTLLANVTHVDLSNFHFPCLHLFNVHLNVHQVQHIILSF